MKMCSEPFLKHTNRFPAPGLPVESAVRNTFTVIYAPPNLLHQQRVWANLLTLNPSLTHIDETLERAGVGHPLRVGRCAQW